MVQSSIELHQVISIRAFHLYFRKLLVPCFGSLRLIIIEIVFRNLRTQVLAVVSIAASNIVYCLMRRKHYGIMLANGMCKADIIWLIAMQNAIVMVLAAVAAWIVRLRAEFETLFPKKVLEETGRLYEGAYVAHMHYMPVILIISVMILLVISCVIPAVMIGRTSLADMVSGRSEG